MHPPGSDADRIPDFANHIAKKECNLADEKEAHLFQEVDDAVQVNKPGKGREGRANASGSLIRDDSGCLRTG